MQKLDWLYKTVIGILFGFLIFLVQKEVSNSDKMVNEFISLSKAWAAHTIEFNRANDHINNIEKKIENIDNRLPHIEKRQQKQSKLIEKIEAKQRRYWPDH